MTLKNVTTTPATVAVRLKKFMFQHVRHVTALKQTVQLLHRNKFLKPAYKSKSFYMPVFFYFKNFKTTSSISDGLQSSVKRTFFSESSARDGGTERDVISFKFLIISNSLSQSLLLSTASKTLLLNL